MTGGDCTRERGRKRRRIGRIGCGLVRGTHGCPSRAAVCATIQPQPQPQRAQAHRRADADADAEALAQFGVRGALLAGLHSAAAESRVLHERAHVGRAMANPCGLCPTTQTDLRIEGRDAVIERHRQEMGRGPSMHDVCVASAGNLTNALRGSNEHGRHNSTGSCVGGAPSTPPMSPAARKHVMSHVA
mmetsp:Transcript_14795/g.38505  ORF Transcript_14795/g.38505 Transcript_14795/m.38505 type:complete len:188 (-) Transcript_14795:105-668(-)